ncbi:carbohydrate kinase family protein [Butyrivibrio sp. AE3004]|uniref:carbohydrate kinase family protein n=1 Tax=Butyrivibrio sp. AE3004 TaxID=1506994 RepID=UPI00068C13A7|nr:carbohydrate kinase family protein [Butyrivibrio sp. AE3004]
MNKENVKISIIGGAVLDVLAGAAGPEVFETGSMPMDYIRTSFGGDALNEAVVLSRLGKKTELITRLGNDEVGNRICAFLDENGVSHDKTIMTDEYASSTNIVLVDKKGERFFLTDPASSQRKLFEDDIAKSTDEMADIVSFASIFVSPPLKPENLGRLFRQIKKRRIILTDMTKPKNGEKLQDLRSCLPYIDYFLANNDEISMLTGESVPRENAELLIKEGVGCAVIKLGAKGCIIKTADAFYEIPAYSDCKVIDTTGAGDSFAAGFLYGLSEKFSLKDCGLFGCAVASCVVENIGGAEGVKSLEEPLQRFEKMKAGYNKNCDDLCLPERI